MIGPKCDCTICRYWRLLFFLPCLIYFLCVLVNRWWGWGRGAASAQLLRLFHAHILYLLEDPVCLRPTHRVLEWLGVLHSVNHCHWHFNSHYRRPSLPFRVHRRPERHCHCSGLCSTGDFSSWLVRCSCCHSCCCKHSCIAEVWIRKVNVRMYSWLASFSNLTVFFFPDTFASKVAATQDQYADASVGNVTGSNAVNVFLGIGVAWSVSAIYWEVKGKVFRVDPGSLAFSVTLFTIFAFLCMGVLMLRRRPSIGGELGGPRVPKVLTSLLFFGLWFLYVLFSSLEAYCHIQGF